LSWFVCDYPSKQSVRTHSLLVYYLQMDKKEIQKRFDEIQKKYYHIKWYLVQAKLDKDWYIEVGKNDKEVKELIDMFEEFTNLIVDIVTK